MLTRLSIKHFASIDHVDFGLSSPVTALVGRNGVGKTNILKAIEWIGRQGSLVEPLEYPYSQIDGMTQVSVSLELNQGRYVYTLGFLDTAYLGKNNRATKSSSVIEKLTQEVNGQTRILFDRDDESVRIPVAEYAIPSDIPQFVKINAGIPALPTLMSIFPSDHPFVKDIQPVRNVLAGIRYYALDEQLQGNRDFVFEHEYQTWLAKHKTDGVATGSVALRLLYMYLEDKPLFAEFLALIGPDGLGLVDMQVVETAQNLPAEGSKEQNAAKSKMFFFLFTPLQGMGGEGKFFNYSNLSEGTRRAIRMIVSLLFDKRSLMLVEQPEDSMHPGLLTKLVDLIRGYSHKIQFIFTTHSPYVLNILEPSEVLLVNAPAGRTNLRNLSQTELDAAKLFLEDEGTFSEFLESVEE